MHVFLSYRRRDTLFAAHALRYALLVGGAGMPGEGQLPDDLRWVCKRSASVLGGTGVGEQIDALPAEVPRLGRRPRGSSRVLWVDDHPANNESERHRLRPHGVVFDNVVSTREAIEQLRTGTYDLVITDVGRAGSSDASRRAGQDLLDEETITDGGPPVVVYGSPGQASRVRAELAGRVFGVCSQPRELHDTVLRARAAGPRRAVTVTAVAPRRHPLARQATAAPQFWVTVAADRSGRPAGLRTVLASPSSREQQPSSHPAVAEDREPAMSTSTTIDLAAFEATRAAVQDDPSVGRGAFTSVTTWEAGARARTTARSFTLETDEPAPLGGEDSAIDPMELILAAVGTCLTIGWSTHATLRGVQLRSLRIEVSGDYDLSGYLGLDDAVRPGFGSVSYIVYVDTDASPDVLEEIRAAAEALSPMVDNVRNATPLSGSVATG